MSHARNFGLQSYCLRTTRDNAAVAAQVRDLGLDRIEVCAAHIDFNDPAEHAAVIAAYREAGVEIVSIGVQTFTGDAERERRWCAFAQAAGAKHISAHFCIDSFTTAIPAACRLAEEYDLRIAVHCHGGYQFGGQPAVLDHFLQLGTDRLGICLDTAWCMQIGPQQGDPLAWIDRFGSRIYGVHYKDFVFEPDAAWRDVVVGSGNLDLPAVVDALDRVGFDGYAVIEYEGDPDDPMPALGECVERMRALC